MLAWIGHGYHAALQGVLVENRGFSFGFSAGFLDDGLRSWDVELRVLQRAHVSGKNFKEWVPSSSQKNQVF